MASNFTWYTHKLIHSGVKPYLVYTVTNTFDLQNLPKIHLPGFYFPLGYPSSYFMVPNEKSCKFLLVVTMSLFCTVNYICTLLSPFIQVENLWYQTNNIIWIYDNWATDNWASFHKRTVMVCACGNWA